MTQELNDDDLSMLEDIESDSFQEEQFEKDLKHEVQSTIRASIQNMNAKLNGYGARNRSDGVLVSGRKERIQVKKSEMDEIEASDVKTFMLLEQILPVINEKGIVGMRDFIGGEDFILERFVILTSSKGVAEVGAIFLPKEPCSPGTSFMVELTMARAEIAFAEFGSYLNERFGYFLVRLVDDLRQIEERYSIKRNKLRMSQVGKRYKTTW